MEDSAVKNCSKCKQTKPLIDFNGNRRFRDGKHPSCKQCVSDYRKLRRQRYPEKVLAERRSWWKSASARERFYAKVKEDYRANPEKYTARARVRAARNPLRRLLKIVAMRAERKSIEFSLSLDDLNAIPIPQTCPVLGLPLEWSFANGNGRQPNTISLDRVDNSQGYVRGNVRFISLRANQLKSNGNIEEFERILQYMKDPLSV